MTEEKKRKVLDLSTRTMTRPGRGFTTARDFGTIMSGDNSMRITGGVNAMSQMMGKFLEEHAEWDWGDQLLWSHGGEVVESSPPPPRRHTRNKLSAAVGARADMGLITESLSRWGREIDFVHLDGPQELIVALREKVLDMGRESRSSLVEVVRVSAPRMQFSNSTFPSREIESLRQHMRGRQHHARGYALVYGGGVHDIISLFNPRPSPLNDDFPYLGYPGINAMDLAPLNMLMDRASAGWWAMLKDTLFVTDPPKSMVTMDGESNILDNPNGPSALYQDGSEIYAISGIVMTKSAHHLYNNPDEITVELVFNETIVDSEEVRRLLIREKGGLESLLGDIDDPAGVEIFTLIEEDEYGQLYEFSSPNRSSPLGRFRVVVVENFTPEPDGSRRKYYLTVPERVRTPKEGVAWTYGFRNPGSFNIDSSA